eukprot:1386406-Amphidinium_carterae.1
MSLTLELLAVVRALEECQPRRVVSDCKGVERARRALTQDCRLQWVKAHQSRVEGRITLEDFQGNLEADEVANLGAGAHAPHESTAEYLRWEIAAKAV